METKRDNQLDKHQTGAVWYDFNLKKMCIVS